MRRLSVSGVQRRLQAPATDGHRSRSTAEVGARGDHARCQGRAGAGNSRRIGAPTARTEESQSPSEDAEPESCAASAPTSRATELCVPTIFWRLSADVLRPRPHCLQSHFKHRAEVIQGVGAQDSRAKPLIRVPGHGGRPRRVARRDRHRAKRFDSMTLYRWPLGDWPELPLLEGSDWLPPPGRAPVGARLDTIRLRSRFPVGEGSRLSSLSSRLIAPDGSR
jgi:hypothetical protein